MTTLPPLLTTLPSSHWSGEKTITWLKSTSDLDEESLAVYLHMYHAECAPGVLGIEAVASIVAAYARSYAPWLVFDSNEGSRSRHEKEDDRYDTALFNISIQPWIPEAYGGECCSQEDYKVSVSTILNYRGHYCCDHHILRVGCILVTFGCWTFEDRKRNETSEQITCCRIDRGGWDHPPAIQLDWKALSISSSITDKRSCVDGILHVGFVTPVTAPRILFLCKGGLVRFYNMRTHEWSDGPTFSVASRTPKRLLVLQNRLYVFGIYPHGASDRSDGCYVLEEDEKIVKLGAPTWTEPAKTATPTPEWRWRRVADPPCSEIDPDSTVTAIKNEILLSTTVPKDEYDSDNKGYVYSPKTNTWRTVPWETRLLPLTVYNEEHDLLLALEINNGGRPSSTLYVLPSPLAEDKKRSTFDPWIHIPVFGISSTAGRTLVV